MFDISDISVPGFSAQQKPRKKGRELERTFDYTNRSVIERSIGFDYQSFGNRMFDCVRLAKFYCEFDYVRLSSAIERLVFD